MTPKRETALDWLRVLATVAIFVFHSGSPFVPWTWHFSSASKSQFVTMLGSFLLLWSMPILFVISGISTALALDTRTKKRFLADRVRRLLIPLIFGCLVIVPPQVYIERISRGQFTGSFLAFYPHYFNAPYLEIGGTGNFAWMGLHLWYLLMLMLITIVTMPLLGPIRRIFANTAFLKPDAGDTASLAFIIVGPILMLALIEAALGPHGLGGWNMLTYPVYFLLGYGLATRPDLRTALQSLARFAIIPAAISSYILLNAALQRNFTDPQPLGASVLHATAGWCWVLTLLGTGQTFLGHRSGGLKYFNDLVLPFYILHQTFIVIFAYLVDGWSTSAVYKFGIILLLAALASVITYEALIRRYAWIRPLFGLR